MTPLWILLVLAWVCILFNALSIRNLLSAVNNHNKAFESVNESIKILRDML